MAAGDRNQFILDLQALADQTKEKPDALLRKVALDLVDRVVKRTPVDTGLLRGNWQVSISNPRAIRRFPDKKGDITVNNAKQWLAEAKFGQTVYILNPLAYAVVVEYGGYPNPPKKGTYLRAGQTRGGATGPGYVKLSDKGFSKQAPQGMVRISVEEMKVKINQIVQSLQ